MAADGAAPGEAAFGCCAFRTGLIACCSTGVCMAAQTDEESALLSSEAAICMPELQNLEKELTRFKLEEGLLLPAQATS